MKKQPLIFDVLKQTAPKFVQCGSLEDFLPATATMGGRGNPKTLITDVSMETSDNE